MFMGGGVSTILVLTLFKFDPRVFFFPKQPRFLLAGPNRSRVAAMSGNDNEVGIS